MVLRGYAPRGVAESELRLALRMGRKIIEIPMENQRILGILGVDPKGEFAENEPKLPLSMGRKIDVCM